MKILLTGGAGFIASHIADRYLELGHEVVIVDNLSTGKKENIANINNDTNNPKNNTNNSNNQKAVFYNADLRDMQKLLEIFEKEKPDIVNHHAANTKAEHSVNFPVEDYEINLLGIINLLECCAKHSVKRFIFASSAAVYGDVKPEDLPIKEDIDPAKNMPISPYGVSKKGSELYIIAYNNLYKIPFVILRYSNVYGPRQDGGEAGVISRFITAARKGGEDGKCRIFGDGKSTRDYVYAGDVVEANVSALDKGTNRIINISTGKQATIMQVFEAIKKIIGRGEFEFSAERKGDIKHSYLDPSLAKQELGWEAKVELEDGLRKTVEGFGGTDLTKVFGSLKGKIKMSGQEIKDMVREGWER